MRRSVDPSIRRSVDPSIRRRLDDEHRLVHLVTDREISVLAARRHR
ncbi:type II toxin-antitoxin system YoeB family toxin [Kitasatospora indigofera]